MADTHEKIKQIEALLALGLTVSEALGKALESPETPSLARFAEDIGVRPTEIYQCFGAYPHRGYPEIRQKTAERLNVPREYIDRLIDSQRRTTAQEGAA